MKEIKKSMEGDGNVVKVSIVMPNFNSARYIENSIQSVLNQTFTDFELIIVDDCSTDNSREIIEKFDDQRIKKVYSKKNRHVAFTVNKGVALAKGDYIARIDSDDIWEESKLEKQVDFMDRNPDIGACFTKVHIINHDGIVADTENQALCQLFNDVENKSQIEWLKYFFYKGNCLCNPSVLIRKKVLEKNRDFYDISYVPAQDFELWTRLLRKSPIHIMDEKLTFYRWENSADKISGNDSCSKIAFFNVHMLIKKHFFDEISDYDFIKLFREEFRNNDSSTSQELEIEKAYLLLDSEKRCNVKWLGIEKFKDILKDSKNLEILENKFNFDLKNYYKLYRTSNFVDTVLKVRISELEKKNDELENEKNDIINTMNQEIDKRDKEISKILNSVSWKVTAPIRKIAKLFK